MPYSAPNIVFRMRWMVGIALLAIAAVHRRADRLARRRCRPRTPPVAAVADAAVAEPGAGRRWPRARRSKRVEVIVQLNPGTTRAAAAPLVRELGGKVTRDLHIINAVAAELPAAGARELASRPEVRAVSPNAATKPQAKGDGLATSYNAVDPDAVPVEHVPRHRPRRGRRGRRHRHRRRPAGLPRLLRRQALARHRLGGRQPGRHDGDRHATATARTSPASSPGTRASRDDGDAKKGRFMGVAPGANLISIKVSDDDGNATVLDVIAGIQFAVDHKAEYNIRVLNLSLESSATESYKTDPLDAAVEAAWFKGIFVVAAAGNRGPGGDAVSHAPGNDPYVVTVGAVDDKGTKEIADDEPTSWSSRGTTQDGFAKPDIYAPGAKIVSNLAPNSKYAALCAECVSDGGEYIRAGGTSMAAPMVAGAAAIGFQLDPTLTPNRIKALLRDSDRPLTDTIDELSLVDAARRFFSDGGRLANQGLEPERLHRPGHRRDRLHALALEPLPLERGRRAAALELEPLELEHGCRTRLGDRQRGRRHRALELEPLELVDQLDQVTLARGPERTARPGIAWARRDSALLVPPDRR